MKQFTSILLAAVMLFGSMGFSMGTHFCGGEAMMDVLLHGQEHMDCGMGDVDPSCEEDPQALTIKKTPCCANEYRALQLEEVYAHDVATVYAQPIMTMVTRFEWPVAPLVGVELPKFFAPYTSPPLRCALHVLYQSFLI